ncbi:MAG: hypothetical protein IKT67_13015 [Lachnospiraceae bacterium]|nr:hypothetical protein [Lachnospiraceae bacterium]
MGKFLDYTSRKEEEKSSSYGGLGGFGRYTLGNTIGIDTFDDDLKNTNKILSDVYNTWQNRDSMTSKKNTVASMRNRLNDLYSYSRSSGQDTTEIKKVLDAYDAALGDWDGLTEYYGGFKSGDAYSNYMKEQAKKEELSKKSAFDEYRHLLEDEEFMKNANYDSAKKNMSFWDHLTDKSDLYEVNKENKDGLLYDIDHALSKAFPVESTKYQYLTDDELSVYYGLHAQDKNQADDFLEKMSKELNKRMTDADLEGQREFAQKNAFTGTISTIGALGNNLIGGISALNSDIKNLITGNDVDANDYAHIYTNRADALTEAVSDNIGESTDTKVLPFLYDTGMSIANSALNLVLLGGSGSLANMSTQAYSSKMKEMQDRGASQTEMILTSALAAGIEAITEKIPMDNLLKPKGVTTLRRFIGETMKQAGIEATEEGVSSILNQTVDVLSGQLGGTSEFKNQYEDYLLRGYTEDEAKKEVAKGALEETLLSALGGAISGGFMGGVSSSVEYSGYKEIGNLVSKNNQTGTLSDIATELNGNGFAEYVKMINEGTANKAQIGSLYQKVSEEADKRYLDEKGNAEMHAIANRANELGDTRSSGVIASAIVKKLSGKSLSAEEKTAIKTDTAKTIMTEIRNGEITAESNEALDKALDRVGKVSSMLTTTKTADSIAVKKRMASMHTGDETIDNATGNKITIEGMRTDDDGNTVLQTSEGERLLDDVTLSDGDAEVVAMAEGMDADKADLFVSLYQSGSDVQSYSDSFELAFAYGKNAYGTNEPLKNKGVLTEAQVASVYELGLRSSTADQQKTIDEIAAKHFADGKEILPGKFDDSAVNYKKLNGRQKAAVSFARMLSEKTGVNIVFFESEADENGHRTAENGRYERNSNTIYVDVYAGMNENVVEDAIIPTLSHEMTHWMKNKAPEAYAKLSSIVMDTIGADMGASPAVLVGAERARFNVAHNADVSSEYAQDELIARACEDMLTGSARAKEILSQMDEKTARTLAEKVKEFFEKFKEWMADLLNVYKSNSNEAKIIRKYADLMNELQETWDDAFEKSIRANQAMEKASARPERMAASERQYAERESYRSEVAEWFSDGMPSGETFILGNTSDVIQGLGAMEMDIYILGDKIKTILEEHPEITIDEIKKIPQILEKPILILASKNVKGKRSNSRIVAFGNVKGKNGQPVLSVLDLKPFEKGIRIDDMQKVSSAYTKTGENRVDFIKQSLVMYADKKRATSLLRTIGFSAPMELNDSGFLGSISYINEKVKLEGKNFSEVFREREIQFSDRASNGNGLTPEQVEFFKDSKIRDENGNLLVMYHGTGRADRVGYHFREDRATSGPMAFFTDSKSVADNYAKDKQDTSLAYDERYRDYYTQFRIEVDSKEMSITEAWDKLPVAKKVEIRKRAPHVTFDDDMENIVYNENAERGTGGFDRYRINEHGGNYLSALVGEWLEDGNLYGQEEEFLTVLSLVGLEDVKYMDPDMRDEKTYQVYLNVKNPFDTTNISSDMVQAFKNAADNTVYEPGAGADTWDKRNIRPEQWIERLESDIANGTTYVWTSIPDFVTDVLKKNGYDGIVDKGGKQGGSVHTVVIPFYSNQVKDITNQNPTEDVDIRYSERQTESIYDAVGELKRLQRENDKLRKDVDRLRQRNRLEHTVTGGNILNENQIDAVAGHILNIADSRYGKETLAKELKEIYTYLQSEGVEWDVFMSKATDTAQRLIAEARERKIPNDYSKMILDTLRTTRVSLNDVQKEEAKNAFGSDWNRMYFGRVLVANDGIPLESVWSEWSMMYPDVFDADISDADMATAVLDAYDTLKASSEIVESYDNAETARAIALEIYNQFWNVSPVRTLADKHSKEVKRLKFEHRQEMKELRDRYNVKKDEAVQTTKERYQKTIQRLKEKRAEDIQFYRDKSREYTKQYKEKLDRQAVINKITKKALKLNTWLVKNSKDEHVPEILKKPVAAVLKSLNFSSERLLGMRGGEMTGEPTQRDISLSKAFENLQSVLVDVSNSQITNKEIEGMYGHLDMPDGFMDSVNSTVKEIHDILRDVGDNEHILNQMTVEQLEEMSKILSTLTHAVRNMNKALATANGESIANLAQDTMLYADSMGQHSKAIGKITDFFNYDNVLPVFAFKRFGEGGQKIFEGLQDGWDKFAFHVKEIIDYTESVYDAKEVREWSNEVHEFELVVKQGTETVKMTTAQVMALYCLQKREQARGHLVAGGIRVADFKAKKQGKVSQPEGAVLRPSDIDSIISVLTDRQVEVADRLQEFMNDTCTDWGNEVSMKRFGYKAFGEENYFPIQSDENNLPQDDAKEQNNKLFRLLNMSFTKGTIKNANNRVVIESIFDVFASHTSDMAKYNALALPILDAFKWYNYKEKKPLNPMNRDDKRFTTIGVKQSLEKAYGEGVKGYIVQFLRDINGESNAITTTEQMSKKLISNYKVASVGANLRVAILQPTAYVRASVLIDPKYLAKAFAQKPQIQKAKDTCGMALWKSLGFYDTNINAGVTEMIKHDDSWYDVAKEKSMFLAEKADELTWGFLYNACEAEVSDNNPGLSGEAKDEAVAKRLREVIYSTQVVDSTMTRTQAMRSRSTWSQIITSFMSEPMVSYNLLHEQFMNFTADTKKYGFKGAMRRNGKYIARTAVTYAITTLCAATMGGLIDTLRDDDEEKEFGEIFFANIKDNALSDVLSMLPLMRDVVSIYKGFGANRLDMQGVTSMVNATKKLAKDLRDGDGISYSTAYSVMRAFSQTSGLPVSNAMRDVVAIWNSTIGEMYESLKLK